MNNLCLTLRRWFRSLRLTEVAALVLAVWLPMLRRWYWGLADRMPTLQSVSKSFTSALIGMAIAKGWPSANAGCPHNQRIPHPIRHWSLTARHS